MSKFNVEKYDNYIDETWQNTILPELQHIKTSVKKFFIVHGISHLILLFLVLYIFKKYTLPALGEEDDIYFYSLALVPNFIFAYYSKNAFNGYKAKLKNIYNSVFGYLGIKNNTEQENFVKIKDIKLHIPHVFITAYIEDAFFGQYNDISFEMTILKMEKLSCKKRFYNKITGSVLVINDFLHLNDEATILNDLSITAKNENDKEKLNEFIKLPYFSSLDNMLNLHGLFFKNGKIFIFVKQMNNFGLPSEFSDITECSFKNFIKTFFKTLSILDELNLEENYGNVQKALTNTKNSKLKTFFKYTISILSYLVILMITFYVVTIFSIAILVSFSEQYWSWIFLYLTPFISIILAIFLTKNYGKQLFAK